MNHSPKRASGAATQVEWQSPAALHPWKRNARTHSKKQVRQIAASIERFGFTNPVLIDADNAILAGHGRVEAAKLLGLAQVPCLRIEGMSAAEKRAYVIADNKLALNAGWDEDILAEELKDQHESSCKATQEMAGPSHDLLAFSTAARRMQAPPARGSSRTTQLSGHGSVASAKVDPTLVALWRTPCRR